MIEMQQAMKELESALEHVTLDARPIVYAIRNLIEECINDSKAKGE